ncbi:hypothetical protein [Burkholderia thailandensis]|uniref:Uncharacterized protein n=1 Tax=Burkholderia thailandensis (strain ATCC 700388 / DSM 13276 / CCUG 48851 / CIP 106301 / E264) TaxID=271848 RepID=Q2T848_BURTA|nr:hypothetical protein [Burkholderia thailandensis]ABC36189.1 conserved hypothetical protein [Burkholderia thailandensis E264]MCS3400415.1 hypothetical protein [Burkholderia thailandensis]MCS6472919.1 hypothetical protein [Burkholderia thailandensis]MCS6508929.1 hypothetical protein [Burkholderia thailandensis]MCS6514235.1 hypothetical protein [Burkholderia thailandensis]
MSIERPIDWFKRMRCFVCDRHFNQRCDRHLLAVLARFAGAHERCACGTQARDGTCETNGDGGEPRGGDVPRACADAHPIRFDERPAARASSPDTRQDF